MKQVLQSIDTGKTELQNIPRPVCGPKEVLILNRTSVISVGTEKMLIDFGNKSYLEKARERPDQVKRVLEKVKDEGVVKTWQQVKTRLQSPLPLGYSSAGIVVECGKEVTSLKPGDSVASNGPHAEFVSVPENLTVKIPKGVSFERAAYTVVSSVAMQGIRLSKAEMGEKVLVIGLGLIGQLTALLLKSAGCKVFGCDLDTNKMQIAESLGIKTSSLASLESFAGSETSGHGFDAVFLTASSHNNSAIETAALVSRKKGRIVSIGQTKLDVPRREFYFKELSLVVSCSYGPGRYDPEYEQKGRDYPLPFVRWTEKRNMEAILELMEQDLFHPEKLTTKNISFSESVTVFSEMSDGNAKGLGIVLHYSDWSAVQSPLASEKIHLKPAKPLKKNTIGYCLLGAGNFASLTLMPNLHKINGLNPVVTCSAKGANAVFLAKKWGFEQAASDFRQALEEPGVNATIIATRHHQHVTQAMDALSRGVHAYIEKPLALSHQELDKFVAHHGYYQAGSPIWMVGMNRRFAPLAVSLKKKLNEIKEPFCITYRINAGNIPLDSWIHDPESGGGRIIGEACHMIDFCSFLTSHPIIEVYAQNASIPAMENKPSDRVSINLKFSDGSIASIQYFAGGDKSFSKERVEVMGGTMTALIDDFQILEIHEKGKKNREKTSAIDKGHLNSLKAFFNSICQNINPPIEYSSLINSTRATLAVMDCLKTGLPQKVE